ncbi:MAG: dihydrodipicolinate synthase family protein [Actinomycetota bacterium]
MATRLEPGSGALLYAAAATPLRSGGAAVDLDAVHPMMTFLEAHGVDGVLACGTTGEGVLLDVDERRAVGEAFRSAVSGTLLVHAGAQTTAQTVALAAHAAEIGADGVAVIAPPYFTLDAAALTAHFVAAARACAPLPFYCYEFAARSGYPLPVEVVARLRDAVDNLAGLKVSDSPWAAVEPYLDLGLPVLIGNEPLLARGLRAGAAGTISGVAAAFPDVVRGALGDPEGEDAERMRRLRDALEASGQFVAAVKQALGRRGVPVGPDVRAPLRGLDENEAAAVDAAVRAELR